MANQGSTEVGSDLCCPRRSLEPHQLQLCLKRLVGKMRTVHVSLGVWPRELRRCVQAQGIRPKMKPNSVKTALRGPGSVIVFLRYCGCISMYDISTCTLFTDSPHPPPLSHLPESCLKVPSAQHRQLPMGRSYLPLDLMLTVPCLALRL